MIFGDWNKYPSHWANRVNDTIQRKAILLADILGLPGEPPLGKVVRSQVEFVEFVEFLATETLRDSWRLVETR